MVTQPADTAAAITKGVAYLRREAPKSNHNPDAARALLVAGARGHDIGNSLDDTLAFLQDPSKWAPAARVDNAAALAAATRAGKAPDTALATAAKLLLDDQKADGSFGATTATWSARATLIESGKLPDDFVIVQIDKWFLGLEPGSIVDASAAILALDQTSNVMADGLRAKCLALVREAQLPGGGWGPTAGDAPQVFDTALAVLALATLDIEPRLARATYRPEELKAAIAGGRAWLVSKQRADGSWPDTLSTTGWAILALLGH
ncbi:MAG: prenyltransferase/squalene oxidase repeat-containing protein [Vicinamibacterales bacterium]